MTLPAPRGALRAVDRVDLELAAGRTLGIVGESGSGKTMLSRAILQLLPPSARLTGRAHFDRRELTGLDPLRPPLEHTAGGAPETLLALGMPLMVWAGDTHVRSLHARARTRLLTHWRNL